MSIWLERMGPSEEATVHHSFIYFLTLERMVYSSFPQKLLQLSSSASLIVTSIFHPPFSYLSLNYHAKWNVKTYTGKSCIQQIPVWEVTNRWPTHSDTKGRAIEVSQSMLGGGSENPRAEHARCQLRIQMVSPGTRGATKELETGLHGLIFWTNCLARLVHLGLPESVWERALSRLARPMLSPRSYLTPNTDVRHGPFQEVVYKQANLEGQVLPPSAYSICVCTTHLALF